MKNKYFKDSKAKYYNMVKGEFIPLFSVAPNRILDIGCGAGQLGRVLREMNKASELVGIEILKASEKGADRPLPRSDDEPVFDDPWQAQVLALANDLAEKGVFTRAAWSDALGAALRDADARGAPDTPETYYMCALAALETLLADADKVSGNMLDERTESWRRAYLNTPHGEPVELEAARKA